LLIQNLISAQDKTLISPPSYKHRRGDEQNTINMHFQAPIITEIYDLLPPPATNIGVSDICAL